jgi:ribosomal protein S18 acetylase RimI-like enzyme
MNVTYSSSTDGLTDSELSAFFVDWPRPPSNEQRRRVLEAASEVILARNNLGELVGFVTAITDGVFAAYIPLLEVLPSAQGHGIGRTLVQRMLARLQACYMIDLVCDEDVVAFYEQLGGSRLDGVGWRNYERLEGST